MSLLKHMRFPSALLSFLEMSLFFLLLTPLWFVAGAYGLSALQHVMGAEAESGGGFWMLAKFAELSVWSWALLGGGYLVVIILYWSPGDVRHDEAELKGFALFLLVAVAAGLVWLQVRHQSLTYVASLLKNTASQSVSEPAKKPARQPAKASSVEQSAGQAAEQPTAQPIGAPQ